MLQTLFWSYEQTTMVSAQYTTAVVLLGLVIAGQLDCHDALRVNFRGPGTNARAAAADSSRRALTHRCQPMQDVPTTASRSNPGQRLVMGQWIRAYLRTASSRLLGSEPKLT